MPPNEPGSVIRLEFNEATKQTHGYASLPVAFGFLFGRLTLKRLHAMAVALVLVVAACGGGSGDDATQSGGDQPNPTQAPATQPAAGDDGSDETAPPAADVGDDTSDSDGSGPSTATVTLGDQTYDFSTEGALVAQCLPDLYGTFSIQLPMVDGDGEDVFKFGRCGDDGSGNTGRRATAPRR